MDTHNVAGEPVNTINKKGEEGGQSIGSKVRGGYRWGEKTRHGKVGEGESSVNSAGGYQFIIDA